MTEKEYEELKKARNTICNFCENYDACERCIVTLLMDQTDSEAITDGIIEDD